MRLANAVASGSGTGAATARACSATGRAAACVAVLAAKRAGRLCSRRQWHSRGRREPSGVIRAEITLTKSVLHRAGPKPPDSDGPCTSSAGASQGQHNRAGDPVGSPSKPCRSDRHFGCNDRRLSLRSRLLGHCSSTRVRWRMVRRISGRCLVMRSKMRRPCPGRRRRTTARPPAAVRASAPARHSPIMAVKDPMAPPNVRDGHYQDFMKRLRLDTPSPYLSNAAGNSQTTARISGILAR